MDLLIRSLMRLPSAAMLQNTFCHLSGIGLVRERRLWEGGIFTWNDFVHKGPGASWSRPRSQGLTRAIDESQQALDCGDAEFFAAGLPRSELWRLFPDFGHSMAALDIETTGRGRGLDHITTVALSDGAQVLTYVHGRDLERFADDVLAYKVIVTFNGSCFDVPMLERELQIRLPRAHIDLRFLFRGLGYRGGLKRLEKRFGLDRGGLDGVDGYAAVLLWEAFEQSGDERVLETLLAYNAEDVLSLGHLLVTGCNQKRAALPLSTEPLGQSRQKGRNPHQADPEILESLLAHLPSGRARPPSCGQIIPPGPVREG